MLKPRQIGTYVLVFIATLSFKTQAQTLYWVGGSGYWNDSGHWSTEPGGQAGSAIPDAETAVIIDGSSFTMNDSEIVIDGPAECLSVHCSFSEHTFIIKGVEGSSLDVFGNVEIPEEGRFDIQGPMSIASDDDLMLSFGGTVFRDVLTMNTPLNIQLNGNLLSSDEVVLQFESLNTQGYAVVADRFTADSPGMGYAFVEDSKMYFDEYLFVSDEIHTNQSGFYIVVSDYMSEENYHPGGLEVITAAQRTTTCGVGPGETSFTITASVISDYNGEDVSCNGADDGEAFVTVSGGIGPFTYQWVGGDSPGFNQTYPNLGAGTYTVLVTDEGQGITCVDNVQVTEPAAITVFSFVYTPPSCEGECNGVGTPIVIGGMAPYDFDWTSGETTQTAFQLCEGSNTMTVTDLNGCVFDSTFTIELQPIYANIDITHVLCSGTSTGSAVSNPSGGDGGPYNFDWSTGDTDNDITGQTAGMYSLTLTDGNGCSIDTTFEIMEEPPMDIVLDNLQDVSCGGLSDGSIEISISGGTPAYDISWSGPGGFSSSNEDISGLAAGDYDLTVTDQNGCVQMASYTVDSPEQLDVAADITDVTCNGQLDGAIDITISGGIPPYNTSWTGPSGFSSSSEDISGLGAGTYDLDILDDNGCQLSTSFEVDEPAPIDLSSTISPITCNGADDASIDLDISGGTGPYDIDWTGPGGFTSSSEDISGLTPGIYDLTVTDQNGCFTTASYTIEDTPPMDVTLDVTDVSCPGTDDGSIDASISGGTPPYTISWVGPNGFSSSNEDISGLEPGQYDLTIVDDTGCLYPTSVIVSEPDQVDLSASTVDIDCGGENTGEIDLTISGGTPPYNIDWTGPGGFSSTDEDLTGLGSGTYDVTVTDQNGCQSNLSVEIQEPEVLDYSADVTPISCNGLDDGSIDLTILGGTPPYIIGWTGPNGFASADEDISGLEPGTYDLSISDQNGCLANASFIIDDTPPIDVTIDVTDIGCPGDNDGSIDITISGGTPPYVVEWLGPNGFNSSQEDIAGLEPGDYDLTITDDTGCIFSSTVTVNQPDQIDLSATTVDINCGGETTGEINLTVSGGSPAYTISWTGPGGFSSNDEDLTGLSSGTYDVTVTDQNGCQANLSVEIMEPELLDYSAEVTPLSCNGQGDGAIDLTIIGGTPAFDINWTGPAGFTSTNEDISGLEPGDYDLSIVDQNGCSVNATFTIEDSPEVGLDVDIDEISCANANDGAIDLTITGGTPPYDILWTGDNGFSSTDEDLSNLEPGQYQVTVTDAGGCQVTHDAVLNEPLAISIVPDVTDVSCGGLSDGAIDISILGGTPDYVVSWTGPNGFSANTEDITGLEAGTYTVTITDLESCQLIQDIEVSEPLTIEVTIDITPIPCGETNTGAIDITISGGQPPYMINWTGPGGFISTDEDLFGLLPGTYDLNIEDQNGCTYQTSAEIEEPQSMDVEVATTNPVCDGDANGSIDLTITGGVPPYVISWTGPGGFMSSDEDIFFLLAGTYDVIITDDSGCELEINDILIEEPEALSVSASVNYIHCAGNATGAIDISVSGGTPDYTFMWNGPIGFSSGDEDIFDLDPGMYFLEVMDDVGCLFSSQYEITSPEELTIDVTVTEITCAGDPGAIELDLNGGTPPYIISWVGPNGFTSSDEDILDLEEGLYTASITDDEGCFTEIEVDLSAPDVIQLDAAVVNLDCTGEDNGIIDITLSGGTAPYVINWIGPNGFASSNEDIFNLAEGTYDLSIQDSGDCSLDTSFVLTQPELISLNATINPPLCADENSGSIEIDISGGVPGYDFVWTGPGLFSSPSEDISNLEPGTYNLNIQDQGNCSLDTSFVIDETPGINIDFVVTDVDCSGNDNGSIEIDVTGGTLPFVFEWEGPAGFSSNDEDIFDLSPGDYDLIVIDSNDCESQISFEIMDGSSMTIDLYIENSTCNESNGTAGVDVSGGADPITITWFDDAMIEIGAGDFISDLAAGLYYVTIVDGNGCEETLEANISDGDVADVEAFVSDILCYGQANGSIDLMVTNGSDPYTFDWIGPNSFTSSDQSIWDLEVGTYTVTIVDALGCIINESYDINEPDSLILSADITDIPCNGGNDGAIDLTVSGGTPGYIFDWSGPGGFISSAEDNADLAFGDYTVFVQDANLCMVQGTFFVNESEELGLDITWTEVLCVGDGEGEIEVTVNGGNPPFNFDWTGPNGFTSTNEDLLGLEPGDYTLTVTDDSFCAADTTITISESPELILDLDVIQPNCLQANGSIVAIPSGGTVADEYSYFWYDVTNGNILISTDSMITGLTAGVFFVEVFDDLDCMISQEVGLSDVEGQIDYNIIEPLCFGDANGAIDITASGGTTPYTYDWTGPNGYASISEDITDLEAGNYTVSVTDSVGCLFVEVIELTQPDSIQIDFTVGNVMCYGESTGSILTSVSGGTPDYLYNWIGPDGFTSVDQNLQDLEAGCYDLQVTDMNLCSAVSQICVEQPDSLVVSAVITNIDCFGDSTGSIELDVIGGMSFYTFNWVGPNGFTSTDEDIYNLEFGGYDLIVTDQNGCSVEALYVVEQSEEIAVMANLVSPSCPGDSDGAIMLEITGGAEPYAVVWTGDNGFFSNNQDIEDLEQGMYSYQLVDSLGCMVSDSMFLADPDSLAIEALISEISCFGSVDGEIDITITGGTPDYSTFWIGPNGFTTTTEDIIGLEPGSYEVTVGDENACTLVAQYEIFEPTELQADNPDLDNPSCPDSQDGAINMDISGGTPGYFYAWIGPDGYTSTEEDIIDLFPGMYHFTVQDTNGCVLSIDSILLEPIIDINAIAPQDTVDCFGNGPWDFIGVQQEASSDYWTDIEGNVISTDSLLSVEPGPGIHTYVYHTENFPCSAADTVVLEVLPPPFVDAGEDQEVYYEQTTVLGGNPTTDSEFEVFWFPDEFLLDSADFNPVTLEMLETTQFVVVATDTNGCVATDTVLVTVIPEIDIPSGFSPNGDSQNDIWDIGNIDFYPNTSVEIYNRWGDVLYRSEGYYKPWDGTINGQPLPIGTYYYIINVNEPIFPDPMTGPVTILR